MSIKKIHISGFHLLPNSEIHLPVINCANHISEILFTNCENAKIFDLNGNKRLLRTINVNESVEMKFNGSRWVETKIKYSKKK